MATLSAHKEVEAIYRDRRGFRYAICGDGKVMVRGSLAEWSLTNFTPQKIRDALTAGGLRLDPADNSTVAAANRASHYREAAKSARRSRQ